MLLVHRSRLIRAGACVRILIRLLASYLQQQSRVEQQQEHVQSTCRRGHLNTAEEEVTRMVTLVKILIR